MHTQTEEKVYKVGEYTFTESQLRDIQLRGVSFSQPIVEVIPTL